MFVLKKKPCGLRHIRQYNLNIVMKLKSVCKKEEWQKVREKRLTCPNGQIIQYQLLKKEKMYDRFLEEVLNCGSIHTLNQYETVLKRMYPDREMSAYIAYVIKEGRLLICMGAILLAESIAPYVVRFHPIRTGKHVVQVMPGEALVVLITWDQPLLHQPYIHLIYHPGSTWKIRLCPGGPVNHNRSDPVASVVLGLGIADVVNRLDRKSVV